MAGWRQWMVLLFMAVPCAVLAQEQPEIANLQLPEPVVLSEGEIVRPAGLGKATAPEIDLRPQGIAPGAASRFYRGHLVPRMSRYLDQIAPMNLAGGVGGIQHAQQQVLHEDFTDLTRRRATRGASRALRAYLLETPVLDRLNRRLQIGRERARDATSTDGEGSGWGLSADITHGRPELGLNYERGSAELRFRVDAFGSAGVEVRYLRFEQMRVVAEYDARDQVYDVFCRVRF